MNQFPPKVRAEICFNLYLLRELRSTQLASPLLLSLSFSIHLGGGSHSSSEFLALKQESRILGHSSNLVCGFSMMELCAVLPKEN